MMSFGWLKIRLSAKRSLSVVATLVIFFTILQGQLCRQILGQVAPNGQAIGVDEEAPEEDSFNKELQRKIRLLQRKLNADDAKQRDEAERELMEIGPKALDYLPDENPSYSSEFNGRLRSIRMELELAVAESIIRPKSVTLSGQYTLGEIVKALSEQTGNQIRLARESNKIINLDWKNTNLLAALDQLSNEGLVSYQLDNSGLSVFESTTSTPIRYASYAQGFRTHATSVRSYLNLDEDRLTTNLTLKLNWEPRLRLIKLSIPRDEIKVVPAGSEQPKLQAEDDQEPEDANQEIDPNTGLPVESRLGKLEFGISRGEVSSQFELPIQSQEDGVNAVDVYGKFTALIAGRSEVFRFEDLTKALESKQEIERSGIRVKVQSRTDDEYLTGFTLTVSFADAKKSLESHFGWVYENPAYLVDPEGVRHEALTVESAGQTENQTSMLFLFDKMENSEGWSLEYHSPGILVETTVPFELKKIRLP